MKRKIEPKIKQKYQYAVVVLTENPNRAAYFASSSSSTSMIINQTTPDTMFIKVYNTLQSYAEDGWRLKTDLRVNDEVMLIFERYHDDFEKYTDEILDYMKD